MKVLSLLGIVNRILAIVCLIAFSGVTGCAKAKRQSVTGHVTLNGKPLTAGIVQIKGPGDRLGTAMIGADGEFACTDLFPGEVEMAVVEDPSLTAVPMGGMAPPPAATIPEGLPRPQLPGAGAVARTQTPIPAKYKNFGTSGLKMTITPETDAIHIDMMDK